MFASECKLISGLRLGDDESYKELYKYHYKSLCMIVYGFVTDYFVAETIVSDVFFSIWENRETLQINQSLL